MNLQEFLASAVTSVVLICGFLAAIAPTVIKTYLKIREDINSIGNTTASTEKDVTIVQNKLATHSDRIFDLAKAVTPPMIGTTASIGTTVITDNANITTPDVGNQPSILTQDNTDPK